MLSHAGAGSNNAVSHTDVQGSFLCLLENVVTCLIPTRYEEAMYRITTFVYLLAQAGL